MKPALLSFSALVAATACAAPQGPAGAGGAARSNSPADRPGTQLVGGRLVHGEWAKADNRAACAPIAFTGDGGRGGVPRRASFGGGWGVAFDLPGLRSAYGVAGTGLVPEDDGDAAAQRRRLAAQWPHLRELPALPQPAFAGYGVEGAAAYPPNNPDGNQLHSLAYLRVAGQRCDYNVWSRLGRTHLELLLDNLRVVADER